MAKARTVSVTLRVSENVRGLLRAAAEDDHRSMANMVEMLILQRCKERSITYTPERKAK